MKDVHTTGSIARICKVTPQTVTKWIDSGALVGYRIPGSKDRRVLHSELIIFMTKQNLLHLLEPEQKDFLDVLDQTTQKLLQVQSLLITNLEPDQIAAAKRQVNKWANVVNEIYLAVKDK